MDYSYDAVGNRRTLKEGSTTTRYRYNAKGERTHKVCGTTSTAYHYDQHGQLLAERTGTHVTEYIYLNGQRLSVIHAGSLYYLHTDHLDTPQAVTDSSKTVVWRADYRPFGEAAVTTSDIAQSFRFPGQIFDGESGLHYNYFRDYNPNTGRYIQSDPIGLQGGVNTYLYAEANSLKFIDPDGLTATCPSSPPIGSSDWAPYAGISFVFHCSFTGFLEVRNDDCDKSPIAECFYDKQDKLVDGSHEYSGCRGTPNHYPAGDPRHIYPDPGGVVNSGPGAFVESMRYLGETSPWYSDFVDGFYVP